jgi:hypothetical protein
VAQATAAAIPDARHHGRMSRQCHTLHLGDSAWILRLGPSPEHVCDLLPERTRLDVVQ